MDQRYRGVALAGLLSFTVVAAVPAQSLDVLQDVKASKILAISDGDFIAQTYGDGVLAPLEAGHADVLTVLRRNGAGFESAALPLSNSVTAAPEILEMTPDGRTAFVTERLEERTEGVNKSADLAPGKRLFAVDVSDAAAPRIADTATIEASPEALAVSPDGSRVAAVSNTGDGAFVQIVSYADGKFGAVQRFNLAELGVTGSAAGPRGGVTATNVQWHPTGHIIAVNVNTQNRIAFFEVSEDVSPQLTPMGAPVEVGDDPFVGRFTPDGGFYLTSNWGRDFKATNLDGRIPDKPSTITVIRLDLSESDNPVHQRLSDIETGNSAEGIAVSPDGRMVATINMRTTAFPPNHPRFVKNASVTLLTFDAERGALTKIADYPIDGVLPEGGTFDASGEHFLATVFEGHDGSDAASGPGLEVFSVTSGDQPKLERIGRAPMPHGVHHVDLVE